ncbi:MAG TPA: RpiB/LacA/LacB family sugar-phosphate isomerase [Candidatus Saccharibacteria bacterium]|nr:RpiB/LacA/LacB family sugar-phosphate isomerase [Candidatus Saccharibacteria bacterium]
MIFYIGADHNGYDLKKKVSDYLLSRGYKVQDEGDAQHDPDDDFTVFAGRVVHAMRQEGNSARGILICGSGQGMVIAANRFKGIRAGLGWSVSAARSIRNDEDSNVIALPAELLQKNDDWKNILDAWITTPFAGATRYKRRNRQLDELV